MEDNNLLRYLDPYANRLARQRPVQPQVPQPTWGTVGTAVDEFVKDATPGFRDFSAQMRGEYVDPQAAAWRTVENFGGGPMASRIAQGVGAPTGPFMASFAGVKAAAAPARELDALGYYSQALEAAKALKQAKGTPEQMLAQLKNAGVKQAEIEATNLKGFLDGKASVTRDEIVSHLTQNRVGLNQRVYDRSPPNDRELANMRRNTGSADDILARELGIGDDPSVPLDRTRWSAHSLDPSNPTYRETVLHLPGTRSANPSALLDEAERLPLDDPRRQLLARQAGEQLAIKSDDFRSGHFPEPNIVGHMMTSMTRHEGKPVYTVDQIQSDWGQKLRDGGVRDEAKIADIKRQMDELQAQYHAQDSKGFFAGMRADRDIESKHKLLEAELRTAEAATPGNPLVNTTDQWTNTTLRRALNQAVESNAEYMAIPRGGTVLSYNPGDEHGMNTFYNNIVPKNLLGIMRKFDPEVAAIQAQQLETPTRGLAGQGFTMFPITDAVRESVRRGQPMFAYGNPVPAAGAWSYPTPGVAMQDER